METPMVSMTYSEKNILKIRSTKNSSLKFVVLKKIQLSCVWNTCVWLLTLIIKYILKRKRAKMWMAHKWAVENIATFSPLNSCRGKQLILYFKTVIKHYLSSISVMHYSLQVAKRRLQRMFKKPLQYLCSMLQWWLAHTHTHCPRESLSNIVFFFFF